MEVPDRVKRVSVGDTVYEKEAFAGSQIHIAHSGVFAEIACVEDVEYTGLVVDGELFAV